MKRFGLVIFLALGSLVCCNTSFQNNRSHAHRKYIPTGESNVQRREHQPVEMITCDVAIIKDQKSNIPVKQITTITHSTIYQDSFHSKEKSLLTRRGKIFLHPVQKPLGYMSGRVGKPTLNILAFIFALSYFLTFASLVLGIIGVALKRPLRGLGIAAICIWVAVLLAWIIIIIIVL